MKIGISGYVGNKLTGIGRVLLNILHEIGKEHQDVDIVLFENKDFDDFSVELKCYSNIRIVKTKVSKESALGNIVWHQLSYQRQLKKYDCDISLIPNFSLLLWKNRPTSVIIHDLIEFNLPEKFSKLRTKYRYFAVPKMAKIADLVFTVSRSSERDIIKYCNTPADKIKVIYNAADKSFFKPYDKSVVVQRLEKYNLEYKDYILFVGTIDYPGKNVKNLIEAYFSLRDNNQISEKLVIIGKNGHNSEVIYDFVKPSKYHNDVVFTGYVEDDDLPLIYSGAKIMTYLSFYEGFGLPVLEAMSCCTAVLCSNTSCFPEIVEELDVTVDPNDINGIATKIYNLISNNDLNKQIAQSCYEKSQKYDWKVSADSYVANLKKLIL
jgi:glycosyltransferase involved in cell wall biosynthesis